jgi:hypothetical protein
MIPIVNSINFRTNVFGGERERESILNLSYGIGVEKLNS